MARGPISHMVKLADGQHVRHHVNDVRKTEAPIIGPDTKAGVLDDCLPVLAPTQTFTPSSGGTTQCRGNYTASFD